MSEEYSLQESAEKLGKLVPIIEDAFGNIIDGFHREQLDPDWPRVKLDHINDPIKLEKARIAINQCRRVVDAEERGSSYGKLVEMTGWTPQELAENTGLSYRTVMRYLPDEFKEKSLHREPVEKKSIATVATEQIQVKNDDEAELEKPEVDIKPSMDKVKPRKFLAEQITCHSCQMSTRLFPELYEQIDGELYCDKCAPKVKSQPKVKPQITEPSKHKESWTERKAHMTPQISRMEASIADQLVSKELSFQSQTKFCLQSTTPDFYFPKQNVAVYLDGVEVHKNRQDKDEALRELLTKRHGVRVLSISYKGTSQKAQDVVLATILEVVQSG